MHSLSPIFLLCHSGTWEAYKSAVIDDGVSINATVSIDCYYAPLLRKYFATTSIAALLHNTRAVIGRAHAKLPRLRFRPGWFAANNIINVMPGAIWLFSLCKFNRRFALYLRARAAHTRVSLLDREGSSLSVGNVTMCIVSTVYFITRRIKALSRL